EMGGWPCTRAGGRGHQTGARRHLREGNGPLVGYIGERVRRESPPPGPRRNVMGVRGRLAVVVALAVGFVTLSWSPGPAQPAPATVRLALLPQWVVIQHRAGMGGALSPDLRSALDGGVVDRNVFAWDRGRIERSALVAKGVRA